MESFVGILKNLDFGLWLCFDMNGGSFTSILNGVNKVKLKSSSAAVIQFF